MSKKHYNKFAELLKEYDGKIPISFIEKFTDILYEDNERFDYVRFMEAVKAS